MNTMHSRLVVTAGEIDTVAITKQLQLKGKSSNGIWVFDGPSRLSGRLADAHAAYWVNLLERHKNGRNALMAQSYVFTIEFLSDTLELNQISIDGLARIHVGIRFVYQQ